MEDKLLKKRIKKIQKYVKKEWGINYITIKPDDVLITIAERIAMISENCNLEESYKKGILKEGMHLPGWIAYIIAIEFSNNPEKANLNTTIKDL